MNEECLYCEWYNKPYWSIISPCTNCPKRFKNNTIKVTNHAVNIDKSELYKVIEQLQQRIDKAIEYIERTEYQYGDEEQDSYDYNIGFDEINELLQILKGEDK